MAVVNGTAALHGFEVGGVTRGDLVVTQALTFVALVMPYRIATPSRFL